MFAKFIVALEGVQESLDALKHLKGLRRLGARECILLRPQNSDEDLESAKNILSEHGYQVAIMDVRGNFIDEINSIADDEECSLIVTVAEPHAPDSDDTTVGFAHELVNRAQIPVLILRSAYITSEYDLASNVLFTTDFSQNAANAFEKLVELVASGVRKVSLVHVQDIARINADISERLYLGVFNYIDTQDEVAKLRKFAVERLRKLDDEDGKALDEMKRKLQQAGMVEVDIQILYGAPSVQINKAADDVKASMIVIGSQGLDSITGLFLGSVTNDIARRSSSSVLVVPKSADKR